MQKEVIEVLKRGTLNGNVFTLPAEQLERKLYQDVAKALDGIGGKWNRKSQGFIFENNPAELLQDVTGGVKRNLKQETQFFETPANVADWIVSHAYISIDDTILEPSAGKGAIVDIIINETRRTENNIFMCEYDLDREIFLNKKYSGNPRVYFLRRNFLELDNKEQFDKIIANPPFSKNQDIDHIMKMWDVLRPKGRIVSVCSSHWSIDTRGKKEKEFREFVDKHEGEVYPIKDIIGLNAFKESGTLTEAQILILDKP